MIVIDRYNPRDDKEELKELFEDFAENQLYFKTSWEEFEKVLDKRVLDLTLRNGMIAAKEDGNLVGWGTYSQFSDYLGKERVLIHQIMIRKIDAYKKGIEEQIIRELEKYIKNTLQFNKAYYIGVESNNNLHSVFMKLGIEKSEFVWHEKIL